MLDEMMRVSVCQRTNSKGGEVGGLTDQNLLFSEELPKTNLND